MTGAQTSNAKSSPTTEADTRQDSSRSGGPDSAAGSVVSGVTAPRRRLPVGAESLRGGGVHFRVWAPQCSRAEVVLGDESAGHTLSLAPEGNGYFSGTSLDAGPGTRYRFRLDEDDTLYPDPASRFQPEGPSGPSMVVDPGAFTWTDVEWRGASIRGQVIYEMHVGTFTPARTWTAAMRELGELARLGVTCVEVMPIGEFSGQFGWGYDGVDLFAPSHLYGEPDHLRRLVYQAHVHWLAVLLHVVYNRL